MKSSVELNSLLWKFVLSGGYSRKFPQRQCKIQLSGDNLREQNVLEKDFQDFREPKIQNFGNHGATYVI